MSRVIAGVVRDPARAEELAVELKLWRNRQPQGEHAEGWLYGAAVCLGLDELWRQSRRTRYERLFGFAGRTPAPEDGNARAEMDALEQGGQLPSLTPF